MVEGQLTLLPQISRPLQDQAEVHLHAGTARVMARLALLEGEQLEPGDRMLVQLRLVEPLALTAGDRFVVRAPMAGMADGQVTTLGGGRIVGTSDRRIRRRQKDLVQRLRRRAAVIDDPLQWCAAHLDECDDAIELPPLAERAGLTVEQCTEALDQLKGSGHAIVLSDGYRVHRDVIDRRASQLMKMLADHHAAEPARLGMQEDAARNTMRVHGELFERIVAEVVERGDVVRKGLILALARHQPQVNTEDAALCRQIESLYRRQGYETARLEELPAQLGQDRSRIAAMAQLLIDGGVLVELDDQIIMHQMHVHQAEKVIRDLFKQAEDFTTAEFRDALGASRKYAIPLLDYFDRRRVTVRHGNRRSAGALGGGNATK
jgi:selenocysteine-specific elongation factor